MLVTRMRLLSCYLAVVLVCYCSVEVVQGASGPTTESCTTESSVRLQKENVTCEPECIKGKLEICEEGIWKILCDNNWTRDDAAVACKALGFSEYGAENISRKQGIPGHASIYGIRCTGLEANFSDCTLAQTDSARVINDASGGANGEFCNCNNHVQCYETDPSIPETSTQLQEDSSFATTSDPTSLPTSTQQNTQLLASTITKDMTTNIVPSSSGSENSNSFLKSPNLYYLIIGVAAVLLAVVLLVLVLAICCCCGRVRLKGISPYDIERQNSLSKEKDSTLRLEVPAMGSTNVEGGLMIHHQLQQSGPIYEAIHSNENSSTHSQESPSSRSGLMATNAPPPVHPPQGPELYSVLDSTDTYAELEAHIPTNTPTRIEPPTPNSDYQLLNHKTSSLKRDRAPPVQAVNRTALDVAQDIEENLFSQESEFPAGTSFSLPRDARPPLPHKGSLKRPHLEDVQLRSTSDCSSSSDHNQENTNIYHIIEPPPDYVSLDGIDESSEVSTNAVCNDSTTRNRHESSAGNSSLPIAHLGPRRSSKSSVSTVPSLHSSSHSSLTSSLSSNSPQIGRVMNSSSPLVSRVNVGPRIANKYTQSPVQSRKDLGSRSPGTAKPNRLSGQSDNADMQSDHSDRSVRNTLV